MADDNLHPPGSHWKVVLKKEARSRRQVEEDDEVYLANTDTANGSIPSSQLLNQAREPDLTGAIVLNDVDNAIALQSFEKQVLGRGERKRKRTNGGSGSRRK